MENRRTQRPLGVIYVRKSLSRKAKKRLKWAGVGFLLFLILLLILIFVVFPIVFMNSITLQRLAMFVNINLPSEQNYFEKYELQTGLRNLYVTIKDQNTTSVLSLGVWHLLPLIFEQLLITNESFDFDDALKASNKSVLLYFHGNGEDRSSSFKKYIVFRYFFHVIAFDYRGYGDSTDADLSEDAVVSDCVQLYEWLSNKTEAPIFLWGHSLGTAIATRTASILKSRNVSQPVGLVLEAPFTKMSEEVYVHPFGKIFAWLPWFKATVVEPLQKNGFIFDTTKHVLNIDYPVMIVNAEDDKTVPYRMGKELYKIAMTRAVKNATYYYQFSARYRYGHVFIYEDKLLPYIINYFRFKCIERLSVDTEEDDLNSQLSTKF